MYVSHLARRLLTSQALHKGGSVNGGFWGCEIDLEDEHAIQRILHPADPHLMEDPHDEAELDARIRSDFAKYNNKDFANSLGDLLPQKMIEVIVARSGIDPHKKVNSITAQERRELVLLLKGFSVSLQGFRPIDEAIVTKGGVSVGEIKPASMESRIVSGLYFAGEILDLDADTGGYNLQSAFSTGYLAGISAAKSL